MIARLYPYGTTELDRLRCGPLGPHLDSFAYWLSEQGYRRMVAVRKIRQVARLSRWLGQRHILITELNEQRIGDFMKRQQRPIRWQIEVQCACSQLLQYLRHSKIIRDQRPSAPEGPIDLLIRDYRRFLTEERGLTQASLDTYLPVARHFLSEVFGTGALRLDQLAARHVSRFVLRATSTLSPTRVQLTAAVLRSLLGFLYQRGKLAAPLGGAVPCVPKGRQADLPRFLEPEQVRQLLQCCDRSGPCGLRDYAILLLLARLGLRAGEVLQLNLDDIDWNSGQILIRGKSSRDDRLPLLPDVGGALAAYLRRGRPLCSSRRVFIRRLAPRRGLADSCVISGIVRQALRRAQLYPAHTGAHLLRHSLATRMLRGGASLAQIAQILRHRTTESTEIYAKVDFRTLRAVAQPWPGGAR